MTRQEAVEFLKNNPVKFAHLLGFTKLGNIHNEWIKEMVRGKTDKTLQASRGTYKTTCVSFALALIIILLPNKRTLFMRKTDTDVKEVIKQVQKILNDPRTVYLVQCIYGVTLKLVVSSATEVSTNLTTDIKGTSQLVGIGTGSSLTGKHFDFIFTDDIVNITDRISRAERERTKTVYQELQNIKNRGGKIFNTGTPWHPDDCFVLMPNIERFDCYHPEIKKIISADELEQIRSAMLPSLFAANYELRHIASENVIFTNPQVDGDPAMVEQGTFHVDAAYMGEDFTAWSVMNKVGDTYYLYGKMKRKHIEECYDELISDYNNFMCGKCYTEDNADKGFSAKELRKLGMKVVSYHENMNKYLKIVTHLKAIWGNLVFVKGTDKEYINQICDYFEDAEHDDAPDSEASLARILYKKRNTDDQNLSIWS
jgi:hypothetical protein